MPIKPQLFARLLLADDPALLSLEQLRQSCHRIMEEYGEGFLTDHMKQGYVWTWALPLYRQYRDQCLSILAYTNQREQEYLKTCTIRQEKYEAVQSIAQLYGWQAFVATGFDLKDGGESSEHDMERCLHYSARRRNDRQHVPSTSAMVPSGRASIPPMSLGSR